MNKFIKKIGYIKKYYLAIAIISILLYAFTILYFPHATFYSNLILSILLISMGFELFTNQGNDLLKNPTKKILTPFIISFQYPKYIAEIIAVLNMITGAICIIIGSLMFLGLF